MKINQKMAESTFLKKKQKIHKTFFSKRQTFFKLSRVFENNIYH